MGHTHYFFVPGAIFLNRERERSYLTFQLGFVPKGFPRAYLVSYVGVCYMLLNVSFAVLISISDLKTNACPFIHVHRFHYGVCESKQEIYVKFYVRIMRRLA